MTEDLFSAAKNTKDAASFIEFLRALRDDFDAATASEQVRPSSPYSSMHGWENVTISAFLDAAAAGAEDNRIGSDEDRKDNPWSLAAQILYIGKIYE